jgi:hypothetical protein
MPAAEENSLTRFANLQETTVQENSKLFGKK